MSGGKCYSFEMARELARTYSYQCRDTGPILRAEIAFSYAPGRGAVHALKLLDGYRGVVQCDGYAAYKKIAAAAPEQGITLAFCWSHSRSAGLICDANRRARRRQ